jgi:hypothetical protein
MFDSSLAPAVLWLFMKKDFEERYSHFLTWRAMRLALGGRHGLHAGLSGGALAERVGHGPRLLSARDPRPRSVARVLVLTGNRMNFVSVILLPMLVGMGVDSGVHLLHRPPRRGLWRRSSGC